MRTETFGLLALESTNVVMKLEKELLDMGMDIRIIPVPKEITANCGLSIKFQLEDLEAIRSQAQDNGSPFKFYEITKKGLKKEIKELS